MNVRWQPHPLPERPQDVGHGLCLCVDSGDGRKLVAHVVGFDWLHTGADAVVYYAPERLSVNADTFTALQEDVARHLREKKAMGTIVSGYVLFPNA